MSIPYLRVPRGRGKLFDDAEVNRGTYISRDSSASGMAKLRDCRLEHGSKVHDRCQVYGGCFHESEIWGSTLVAGAPHVFKSVLNCSEVSGRPRISYAHLIGNTEVCDSPYILGTSQSPLVLNDAIVYGSPEISGAFTVTGRVHEGVWTRPPKHIKLPWVNLSECVDGKVLLDCYCRKAEWFLRFGHRLAAKWDWSSEMVEVTMDTIRREFMPTKSLPELPHETIMRV